MIPTWFICCHVIFRWFFFLCVILTHDSFKFVFIWHKLFIFTWFLQMIHLSLPTILTYGSFTYIVNLIRVIYFSKNPQKSFVKVKCILKWAVRVGDLIFYYCCFYLVQLFKTNIIKKFMMIFFTLKLEITQLIYAFQYFLLTRNKFAPSHASYAESFSSNC